jgi:guanylate kinase
MIKMKEFREWNVFGDSKWYYGTTLREFKASSLFVMTPSGVRSLTADERAECFVIYLDIEEDVRLKRLKDRYGIDDPETERRLNTDRRDFEDFKDFDLRITNPDW